jgi:CubicO group peptidase (beta-lactamase class C family)
MPPFDRAAAAAHADATAAGWCAEGGPGGAIILLDRDGPTHAACGGLADLGTAQAITPATAFRWASITKQVLAATTLRAGPPFESTLGEHLAELSPGIGAVTLARALDMTSGLPDAMEAAWQCHVPPSAAMSRAMLYHFVARLPGLNYPQGTEISYTNTGYRLVQQIIEKRIGPLGAAWREAYFRPLGLHATQFPEDWTEVVPALARGYWRDDRGWHEGRYGPHFSGSGGLAGSATDLAVWCAALMAGAGPLAGVLDALSAPRRLTDGQETGYGLGLGRSPLGPHIFLGHGGSLPGFKNHVLVNRDLDAGVVVLTNREDTDSLGLALAVMAAGCGVTQAPPVAPGTLRPGLYAAEDGGPFWIEGEGAGVTFLGTTERLYDGGDGWAVSRSPYMWIRLRHEGGRHDGAAIAGAVNHVARRFVPVRDARCDPAWAGDWRCAETGAAFTVAPGGEALTMGAGPLRATMPLTPLGGGRALFRRADGPWAQLPCLSFRGDTVRVVTNRCRVLDFSRA